MDHSSTSLPLVEALAISLDRDVFLRTLIRELSGSLQDMKVGIGMVSRGEVGLIVAGVGVSAGAITSSTYTSLIIMVAATTFITPVLLKIAYRKELTSPAAQDAPGKTL
jgi:Kef-type K+ transport system membrane component KefB